MNAERHLSRLLVWTIAFSSFLFCCSALGADSLKFRITSGGQPIAEIVIEAREAGPPLEFAAQELKRYVKQMSGAELPLVRERSKKPTIVLISRPLDKQAAADSREVDHYRLRVDSDKLSIEGASPRAVLFGV